MAPPRIQSPEGMLRCPKCQQTLALSSFPNKKQGYPCRTCYQVGRRKRYIQTRDWIDAYKRLRGCCACGEEDPVCLELHHVDPAEKKFSVGSRKHNSKELLLAEMEKCVVLCANCHAKLHWKRADVSI